MIKTRAIDLAIKAVRHCGEEPGADTLTAQEVINVLESLKRSVTLAPPRSYDLPTEPLALDPLSPTRPRGGGF